MGFVEVGVGFGFVELVDVSTLVFALLAALARRQGFNHASVVTGILDWDLALVRGVVRAPSRTWNDDCHRCDYAFVHLVRDNRTCIGHCSRDVFAARSNTPHNVNDSNPRCPNLAQLEVWLLTVHDLSL